MFKTQVEASHYDFNHYLKKARWASVWHQVYETLNAKPASVLEIGPGSGTFKALVKHFGVSLVETLDIDPNLNPDHIGSAETLPFPDNRYDVVCAFQVLEHVPYETSLKILSEMARVAKLKVIISLPDSLPRGGISFHISKVGSVWLPIFIPSLARKSHRFDGQHYWEINKKGYSLNRLQRDMEACSGMKVESTYRVNENLYHRFFLFTPQA